MVWNFRRLGLASCIFTTILILTQTIPLFPSGDNSPSIHPHKYSSDIGFPATRVLAHVPGYTVLENAYWRAGKVQIYTDEWWSFPNMDHVTRRYNAEYTGFIPDVELFHIMDEKWSADVNPVRLKYPYLLRKEAMDLVNSAIEVPGVTFATCDISFLSHYYHFVGELFLPMWKMWTKAYERHEKPKPTVDNLVFFNADNGSDSHGWQDGPGVNLYTMTKAFPGTHITTVDDWSIRAESNRLYCFPYLLLVSRRAGHEGPNSAYKPFGDVMRLPVGTSDWWADMRNRLLSGHTSVYGSSVSSKPVVTYLSRQKTGRRLSDESHDALVEELEVMDKTGLMEYRFEEFEHLSIPEQWARIALTTILVSVHGNGLTHIVVMPNHPASAVYEIQPRGCHLNDYTPLAIMRGIPHFMVQNDLLCSPIECGPRGCQDGITINRGVFDVDARTLVNHIRQRLGIPLRYGQ